MKILRQSLEVVDYQPLTLPNPARILSVAPAESGVAIDLWFLDYAEVAEARLDAMRRAGRSETVDIGIYIVGTGNPMPGLLGLPEYDKQVQFIGTCVLSGPRSVWHVFSGPTMESLPGSLR